MPATTPPNITALPAPPDPNDRSTFNALAYPWSTAQQTLATQMGALASNVYSNAQAAEAAATAADLDAAAAAADKIAAAGSATTATTQNGQAQTAATTATTQAGIASTQRGLAETAATTATTQAGAATTALASAAAITLGVASGHPTLRPTLNLNFAQARSVDPRITFTRASSATRTNSRGLLETVAYGVPRIDFDPITLACRGLLIEEARTNLLTYSQEFDNAAWTKTNSSVTANTATAPDGTATADTLNQTGATTGYLNPASGYSITSGQTYTFSCYLKKIDQSTMYFLFYGSNFNSGGANCVAQFNLDTGVSSNAVGVLAGHGMQSVGNGWWRCWATVTATTTTTGVVTDQLLRFTDPGAARSVYVWGAQLEAGAFPTSYIPSSVTHTGRSSTATFIGSNGLIQTAASGAARYSYNPLNLSAAPALLLEGASTNLLLRSEEFDNAAWTKLESSITANATTAPDGTSTADRLVESSATATHRIFRSTSGTTNTQPYTFSVYAKADTRSRIYMSIVEGTTYIRQGNCHFDLLSNTVTSSSFSGGTTGLSSSMQPVGNGWVRCSVTLTLGGSDTTIFNDIMIVNGSTTYTGDGTSGVFLWGAQLEAGSYPTSYIPTTASQVTRAADTSTSATTTRSADLPRMTGANFSSWYRHDEGTFVVDYRCDHIGGPMYPSAWYADGGNPNRFGHSVSNTNKYVNYDSLTAGVSTAYLAYANAADDVKSAFAYRHNDMAASTFGAAVISDTSTTVPSVNAMTIGGRESSAQLNGHIRSLRYYPKRLTNTELQTLTQE